MKITHFFVLIFLFSISLLFLLKPEQYQKADGEKIPQMEIEDFTLYEIDTKGVKSVVSGTIGRQYELYYEVENAHYVENKNKLGEHLYADKGKFEKDIAYLDENVRYFRDDGLSFESDHAVYDTNKELLFVPKSFVLTQNENIIYGNELHYNAKSGDIDAKEVNASYYTKDRK